ncbi:MAG TPA: hypothetical protein VFB36_02020 [Nevskiaceae bacterium]|nr:hypothetical protein [Nevskiaceae bacterium]
MDLTGAELIHRFLDARRPAAQALLLDLRAPGPEALRRLAAARKLRVPLVAFARQVPRRSLGGDLAHWRDRRTFLDTSCRPWFHVGAATELLQLLPSAYALAERSRGPVLLEIPEDVFAERIYGAWIPHLRQTQPDCIELEYA